MGHKGLWTSALRTFIRSLLLQGWFGVGKKYPASNLRSIFQLEILSMASPTDPSQTLYPWKTRVKMVRYKSGHLAQYCRRRAPCSSAHNVTENTKETRWILSGAGFDRSFHRVEHSWWEIVNNLDSSFRVWAVSLGQSLWPCEGRHGVKKQSSHCTVC